ncbi:MAG TPA: hypothetical protein VGM50_12775, partial [Gemmatimonadaceae bacterium]
MMRVVRSVFAAIPSKFATAAVVVIALLTLPASETHAQRIDVRLDPSVAKAPQTGRVFVFFAKNGAREPRLQAGSYGGSVPFYGVDVDQWTSKAATSIDAKTLGFPYETLSALPAGDYVVQAMLVPYTRFARADGHVIWVHNDQWEGQQFNRAPGNVVSAPTKVHWDPHAKTPVTLTLSKVLPTATVPPDTRYVKRIKIKSELLSKFWGQPMYIGATVLLPKGFDQETTRRYPAVYIQGHFGLGAPFGFTETPGSETAEQRDARLKRSAREPGWMFARDWLSDNIPRMVAITWQHPTPYYDDSYAVNSVNNGPYQDALLTELVPILEKQFRLIPEPNARFLTGGSTGGWECAALQVQRPDFFGGAWCLYPDPVDFHRNQMVDNYADTNAFVPNDGTAPWPERYMSRTEEGQPLLTERMMSRLEEVRGTRARSGEQFDAWDAAYGPIGADGYPKRLWNRLTGTIDKSVVAWWR